LVRIDIFEHIDASRIARYLADLFQLEDKKIYLWSDSTIALHWIKSVAREWKPFVSNRVTEIHSLIDPKCWHFCPRKSNPADKLTKPDSAVKLIQDEVWFKGAAFLRQPEELWPPSPILQIDENTVTLEKKPSVIVSLLKCHQENVLQIENYSSLQRLYRVSAWILRYLHNSRPENSKRRGPLMSEEISSAEKLWVKKTQKQSFPNEYERLLHKKKLDADSSILSLSPFLDEDGIMRVGGRLQHSNFNYSERHPALLPAKSKYTELVIIHAHQSVRHSGVADTLTQAREKFWIIRGRQAIKTVLNRCIICKRFHSKTGLQDMAPLPANRITESPPFTVTGLDFAGPLYARDSDKKYYICIFACSVTRAVHLELVPNQNTETFLLALRRFTARKGLCSVIYSDNAKTFKSADKFQGRMVKFFHVMQVFKMPPFIIIF